jgi:multidrug resistance efflux pump
MAEQNTMEDKEKAGSAGSGRRKATVIGAILTVLIVGTVLGVLYWRVSSKSISIDQSVISAPLVALSPVNSGILETIFVNEGDTVIADEPVARVGDEIVKAKTAGEIVTVSNNVGAYLNVLTGEGAVASMIDPTQLRVIGHLEENKGLSDIHVGDPAEFSVDAFGSKLYQGIVDEISPTSRASDVVFNISDQRPTNEFDIKVRFDPQKYPELKNGMSARIRVYKQ